MADTDAADEAKTDETKTDEVKSDEAKKTDETKTDETDDYKGAGSKAAVLADLKAARGERDTLKATLAAINKALGGEDTAKVDPEKLASDLANSQAEAKANAAKLAVAMSAPAGVDVAALLDSTAFGRKLAAADLDKDNAVKDLIEQFVKDNPRFRSSGVRPAPGQKDTTARTDGATGSDEAEEFYRRGARR